MALDIFVVLIYAAGMIALGWYGMRRAKTRDDYLVAGRNLGPGFYLGTMAATVLGGASTIGTVRLGYVHGSPPAARPWPRSPAPPPVSTACSTAWPGR